MRRVLLISLAFFGLAAAPARASGLPTMWCGSETAADDVADATFAKTQPQFKVVYVYPSDRPDRFAQWQDLIQTDVSLIDQFVSSQPGSSRAPRFDLGTACGPQFVDIETIPLPGVRAGYVQDSYDVEWYVKRHVNLNPGGKRNYVIIADTLASGAENGYGEVYEGSTDSDRPDLSNEHNLGGMTSILFTPDAAAPAPDPDGWWPEGVLHEMTHNLGAVQWSAPHSTQRRGYTDFTYSDCWDGRDVMCEQDGPDASHAYDPTVCAGSGGHDAGRLRLQPGRLLQPVARARLVSGDALEHLQQRLHGRLRDAAGGRVRRVGADRPAAERRRAVDRRHRRDRPAAEREQRRLEPWRRRPTRTSGCATAS